MTRNDAIYEIMSDFKTWTLWQLEEAVYEKTGIRHGAASISAGMREFRTLKGRERYNLPLTGEVLITKQHKYKASEYRLAPIIIDHQRRTNSGT